MPEVQKVFTTGLGGEVLLKGSALVGRRPLQVVLFPTLEALQDRPPAGGSNVNHGPVSSSSNLFCMVHRLGPTFLVHEVWVLVLNKVQNIFVALETSSGKGPSGYHLHVGSTNTLAKFHKVGKRPALWSLCSNDAGQGKSLPR